MTECSFSWPRFSPESSKGDPSPQVGSWPQVSGPPCLTIRETDWVSRFPANPAPPVAAYKQQAHPVLPTLPNLPTGDHYTFTKIPVNTTFASLALLPIQRYIPKTSERQSLPNFRWKKEETAKDNPIREDNILGGMRLSRPLHYV